MYVNSLLKHLNIDNSFTRINLVQFLIEIFNKYGVEYFQKFIDVYYL